MLKLLKHKYIINMLDYIKDKNVYYLVMEKPHGYGDLYQHIKLHGPLSEQLARIVFRNVLEAIQYCHSKGVIHGDIKEENILVDANTGDIKLIDFGAATFLHDERCTKRGGTVNNL